MRSAGTWNDLVEEGLRELIDNRAEQVKILVHPCARRWTPRRARRGVAV